MANNPSQKPQLRDDLRDNARRMRSTDKTDGECRLWSKLRGRKLDGFKFRRQHPIDSYILDFYCDECRLAVEIDGGQHFDDAGKVKDEVRTARLTDLGISVLRYQADVVLRDTDLVLRDILKHAIARAELLADRPHPNPLPGIPRVRGGEGAGGSIGRGVGL